MGLAWLRGLGDRLRPLRGEHRQRGRAGERLAERHLREQGWRILARNVRNRFGELDLIGQDPAGTLVFVEVKAGASRPGYPPEVHVTPAKQRKIVGLAAQFARRHRLTDRPMRFDVIAVEFSGDQPPAVRHHRGAFEARV